MRSLFRALSEKKKLLELDSFIKEALLEANVPLFACPYILGPYFSFLRDEEGRPIRIACLFTRQGVALDFIEYHLKERKEKFFVRYFSIKMRELSKQKVKEGLRALLLIPPEEGR